MSKNLLLQEKTFKGLLLEKIKHSEPHNIEKMSDNMYQIQFSDKSSLTLRFSEIMEEVRSYQGASRRKINRLESIEYTVYLLQHGLLDHNIDHEPKWCIIL